MIRITLPNSLKKYTENVNELEMEQVESIDDLLNNLVGKYPQLRTRIFSNSGQLHTFINAFVDGKNIRHLDKGKTKLHENSHVTLVAAIAGG